MVIAHKWLFASIMEILPQQIAGHCAVMTNEKSPTMQGIGLTFQSRSNQIPPANSNIGRGIGAAFASPVKTAPSSAGAKTDLKATSSNEDIPTDLGYRLCPKSANILGTNDNMAKPSTKIHVKLLLKTMWLYN